MYTHIGDYMYKVLREKLLGKKSEQKLEWAS